jgi:enediyne biosynthesis protein E4
MVEKRSCTRNPHRVLPVICMIAPLLFLSRSAQAQMGVATGGGVAVPGKPLPSGMKPPVIDYRDIATEAGLTGVNTSGPERGKLYIIESTGLGVAIIDYDNDGLPDIFMVNGGRLQANKTVPAPFSLYHNLGGLKFEDVTQKAGLTHAEGWGQGVCAGDIDNDGHVDLFVTQWGQNILYHNQGDGTFRDETKERRLTTPQTRWTTGCAFVDFNRDGFLDLVVAHYVDFDLGQTPHPGEKSECRWKGLPVMCGPRGLPGETITLYENDKQGHFADVSDRLHITTAKMYYGFSPLVGDFDNDGWPDIYVACDSTASLYYHNLGGKRFEEIGVQAGVAYSDDGAEQAGMGVAAADFTHDGMLDIFKTNFADDTPTFYRNRGKDNFTDKTIESGLAVSAKYVGWGTSALDFDNDGWPDLIIADGHVYPEVDHDQAGESFKQPRLLFWNRGDGQFFNMSSVAGPGIVAPHSSRGLAVGDLDNDGQQEIVIVNMAEGLSLLKNFSPRLGNSILIRALTGTARDAIGAQITVTSGGRSQMDEVRSGGSYMSQSDFRLHFGLGTAISTDVSIRWPDGKVDNFRAVAADQIVTIQQGKGIIHKQPYAHARS